MKILLVEDNPVNIKLALILLKKLNHSVSVAKNGQKAVDLFVNNYDENPFDFVLMDIHMPVMNGFEASRGMRDFEKDKPSKTPIIGMTATLDKDHFEKCSESGMDQILTKPINLEKLEKILSPDAL